MLIVYFNPNIVHALGERNATSREFYLSSQTGKAHCRLKTRAPGIECPSMRAFRWLTAPRHLGAAKHC